MFSTGQRQMPHSENESIAFLPSVLLFESVHFVCVAPATATCASPSHPIRHPASACGCACWSSARLRADPPHAVVRPLHGAVG